MVTQRMVTRRGGLPCLALFKSVNIWGFTFMFDIFGPAINCLIWPIVSSSSLPCTQINAIQSTLLVIWMQYLGCFMILTRSARWMVPVSDVILLGLLMPSFVDRVGYIKSSRARALVSGSVVDFCACCCQHLLAQPSRSEEPLHWPLQLL